MRSEPTKRITNVTDARLACVKKEALGVLSYLPWRPASAFRSAGIFCRLCV